MGKRIIAREVEIEASDTWKEQDIADNLIRGNGWKGFGAGIGSKPGKVKVTVTVERMK